MTEETLRGVLASADHLDPLIDFYRRMDREQGLDADAAEDGLRASLLRHDFFEDDRFLLFLAMQGSTAVGCASVAVIPKLDDRFGVLFIDELYVLRAHRRRGAASILLRAVVRQAQQLGLWRVRLLTQGDNLAARRLYDRNGFDEVRLALREYAVPRRIAAED